MTEATVTEALRGLLAEGLTSGEIIARGYRPGTVYKVQRSLRLAAALAEPTVARSERPDQPGPRSLHVLRVGGESKILGAWTTCSMRSPKRA